MDIIRSVALACLGLILSTGAALACPDYNLSGDTYELTGRQLYTEQVYSVRAGGDNEISRCPISLQTDRGNGYVTTKPDFTFHISDLKGYRLDISVVSECDSVLLVNTAAANWYYDDDDNGNLDARLSFNRPSEGWLDVWIGTHDGSVCDAVLQMETFNH